jgi:gliding motility-associated-like protein
MKKHILIFGLTISGLFYNILTVHAQAGCNPQTPVGVNLISNGDFEQGYKDLTTDYINHFTQSTANGNACVVGSDCTPPTPFKNCGCSRNYSLPNDFLISNSDTLLHHAFIPITDHTSGKIGGGLTMFVDGSCSVKKPDGSDFVVWSRTVNIVPNTNYYFSAWIASLGLNATLSTDQAAVLAFKVNGVLLGTLAATTNVNEWVTYTRNWYSGTVSGPVTIAIVNTQVVACTNGDDFALDDITFTAGCAFASQGPKPSLGPDFSLCDKKLPITLSSGIKAPYTNINIKWSTGETTPSINITLPGTYSVCVDSAGSCTRSDIITITDSYQTELGPDLKLCNPLYTALNSNVLDSTNFNSILWFKDGVQLSGSDNFSKILVNTPGTYWVNIKGPGNCNASDSVVVTSGAGTIPVNATYCVGSGTNTANLSVSGVTTVKWYAAATGGVALAKGPSFTTPVLTSPGPVTYWAEDTTSFAGTVGESGTGFTSAGYAVNSTQKESKLKFDALVGFRLEKLTVGYYSYNCAGTKNITITILNANGVTMATKTVAVPCAGVDPSTFEVTLGIDIPKGVNYTITGDNIAWNNNGPVNWYPKTYAITAVNTDILTITGNYFDVNYAQWSSPSYFNWKISVGAACGRVPVYATEFCTCKPAIVQNPGPISVCGGSANFSLIAKGAGLSYKWKVKTPSSAIFTPLSEGNPYSGTTSPTLSISNAVASMDKNVYECDVTGSCGTVNSRPALLSVSNVPPLSLGKDTMYCPNTNNAFVLRPTAGFISYTWQDNSTGNSYIVSKAGDYTVTGVSQGGCKASAAVHLAECDNIYIPNVITPFNHDGKNDYFVIQGNPMNNAKIEIYNRWGSLIFHKDNYQNTWAGDGVGSEGTYYYIFTLANKKPYTGFIEVLK